MRIMVAELCKDNIAVPASLSLLTQYWVWRPDQASSLWTARVTSQTFSGWYQKSGLASYSGLWASPPPQTTLTNQTERQDLTFDTTLKKSEVLLSRSGVTMPGPDLQGRRELQSHPEICKSSWVLKKNEIVYDLLDKITESVEG